MRGLIDRIREITTSLVPSTPVGPDQKRSSSGVAVFISVLAAVLIWFMISMRETYSVVRDFPVQYIDMPPDSAFARQPLKQVRARVEGAGWQLLKLYTSTSPIRIESYDGRIDLQDAAARSLEPGLSAQAVTPEEVTLPLEMRTETVVPVRVRAALDISPPFDILGPIVTRPDSVRISGAVSVLSGLNWWPTEVLERDRVNTSFSTTVPLSDTLSGLVDKSASQVVVSLTVAEFTENRRLLNVKVAGAPEGEGSFRLIPDQVSVRYRVPIAQFETSAVTDSFYATVSYSDILSDTTGRISPSVNLPPDVVIRDLTVETPRLQYYIVLD